MSATDGRQLKAGRVILGMTINDMADAAGINRNSVMNVEKLQTLPLHAWAADRIAAALEQRGITFTAADNNAGVCFTAAGARKRRRPWPPAR